MVFPQRLDLYERLRRAVEGPYGRLFPQIGQPSQSRCYFERGSGASEETTLVITGVSTVRVFLPSSSPFSKLILGRSKIARELRNGSSAEEDYCKDRHDHNSIHPENLCQHFVSLVLTDVEYQIKKRSDIKAAPSVSAMHALFGANQLRGC